MTNTTPTNQQQKTVYSFVLLKSRADNIDVLYVFTYNPIYMFMKSTGYYCVLYFALILCFAPNFKLCVIMSLALLLWFFVITIYVLGKNLSIVKAKNPPIQSIDVIEELERYESEYKDAMDDLERYKKESGDFEAKLENWRKNIESKHEHIHQNVEKQPTDQVQIRNVIITQENREALLYYLEHYRELSDKYGEKEWFIIGREGVFCRSENFEKMYNTFYETYKRYTILTQVGRRNSDDQPDLKKIYY